MAVAGPGANLFMALCWAFLLKMAWLMPSSEFTPAAFRNEQDRHHGQLRADGPEPAATAAARRWRIAVSLLPHNLAWKFAQLERWGFPFCCSCYSPVFSVP